MGREEKHPLVTKLRALEDGSPWRSPAGSF